MANPYVTKEVEKLYQNDNSATGLALISAWIIAHYKGVNLKIYDVHDTSSLCDFNLLATAENSTQAKAMVDEIVSNFKLKEINIVSLEGMNEAEWILLDIGDVIVHIFQEHTRDVFDLDHLWAESPLIEIPQEFYFGTQSVDKPSGNSENYF